MTTAPTDVPSNQKPLRLWPGVTELSELSVDGLQTLSRPGLEHLKGLLRLTELYLFTTGVADAGLGNLKDVKQLTKLTLPERIGDAGLSLLDALTNLGSLNLQQLKGLSGPGLAALKEMAKITDLDLSISAAQATRRFRPISQRTDARHRAS
jgi:hypothetical protein